MKLSIIVPVYNMAADGKLEYCLDSLVGQTIAGTEEYEIIAVDDASTDNSLQILQNYRKKYPKLIKIETHAQNGRQGKAKNTGLNAAVGEWVGFIDSDDWAAPDMYEQLLRKADATGADIVGCNLSRVTEHTMIPGKTVEKSGDGYAGMSGDEFRKRAAKDFGYMVLKIYKRSVIEENHLRFPEGIFYEDNCAGVIWPLYFEHFEKVDEPLYFYYQHGNSTVHAVTMEKCLDRMKAMECMYEDAERRGLLKQYSEEIKYRYIQLYFYITLFSYMIGVRKKHFSFVKNLKKGLLKRVPDYGRQLLFPEMFVYPEEEKMVRLCMKNALAFYIYYNMLLTYRRLISQRPKK